MGSYHTTLSPYSYSCSSITPRLRYHAGLSTYILSCSSVTPRLRYHAGLSSYILSCSSITPRHRYHAVLSTYILSCSSISPWLRYHAVLSTYIQTCQFHLPSGHSYHAVHAITLHPVMQFHHSTACHAIRSARKICSYPINQRTVSMPPRPLGAKTQPASIEESCLHTALQINRNCLARYISCPSQCTRAVS